MMVKQRYGVAGVPLCNCSSTCRWPRGKCPNGPLVFGEKRFHNSGLLIEAPRNWGGGVFGAKGDTKCTRCGYPACACKAAEPPKPADEQFCQSCCRYCIPGKPCLGAACQLRAEHLPPDAVAKPADENPEGWMATDRDKWIHGATRQFVYRSADNHGMYRCFASTSGPDFHATRAEAMAAALGFEIVKTGLSAYWRRGEDGHGHWATAAAAALDALRFDAAQRRKAAG